MKVLLINPPPRDPSRLAKKVHPPLNLLYLATNLKNEGIDVEVLDACAARLQLDGIGRAVAASDADVIGIPVFSDILYSTFRLAETVRRSGPGARIVLGGVHASADPQRTLEAFSQADFLLTGQAERSLVMLVRAIRDGASPEHVPGLWYRTEDGIGRSEVPCDVLDLNALPFPDRSFVRRHYDRGEYYQILTTRRFDSLVTGRGCPYDCRFCYNASRGRVLLRSADDIYEEIRRLVENGVRFLDVDDDNFALDRSRAHALLSRLAHERLDLSLFIKTRPDNMDRDLLRLAARAGVAIISYGLESGDQRILDATNKRMTVEHNAQVVAWTRAAGIQVHAGFLLGFPGETPDTIRTSINYARSIGLNAVSVQVLKPYPGTDVYEQARAEGTLEDDWSPTNRVLPWVRLPWTRTRRDLDRQKQLFLCAFYLRPRPAAELGSQILRNFNGRMARFLVENLWRLAPWNADRDLG